MDKLLDLGMDFLLPQFTSQINNTLHSMQAAQKPPFSDGIYFIELRTYYL